MMYNITLLIAILLLLVIVSSCKSVVISQLQTTEINLATERKQDSLAFELCQIYGSDQGIRDSRIRYNKREIMPKVDTLSFIKIVNFVTMNGYPTEKLLGEKTYRMIV